MDTLINTTPDGDIKGHLEIIKIFDDGREEVHFADENVITSGMGHTLLTAFSTSGVGGIADFQIVYFQLGEGGTLARQEFSSGILGDSLSLAQYGTPSFETDTHDYKYAAGSGTDVFGVIPFAYIKKITPTRVMYQIFMGTETANEQTINEVGLWSRNPDQATPVEASYLCAYRFFTPLAKTDAFSVLFRWTIEF